jgi:S-DNA-T family DNA segregation ATPase FtsK/SpoIIIE
MHLIKSLNKPVSVETVGFLLLGFGLFLGMAIATESLAENDLVPESIRYLGGPLGQSLALPSLKLFGVVSYLYPLCMLALGALMATGRIGWPKPKTFAILFFLTLILAGLAHLMPVVPETFSLQYGIGGVIGSNLGDALLNTVGYGGALISLGLIGAITQVIAARPLAFKTAEVFESYSYSVRRTLKKAVTARSFDAEPQFEQESGDVPGVSKNGARKREVQGVIEPSLMDFTSSAPKNRKPAIDSFHFAQIVKSNSGEDEADSTQLTQELREFKVDGKVTKTTEGPLVTTYEYEPAAGTRVAKIVGLGGDLARLLKAPSLRVIAPIPGKGTVGFEIPNQNRREIGFGNIVNTPAFTSRSRALPVAMGVDTFGKPVVEDLADMPHLLVAGSTGSGKSVFLNTLIASLICRLSAKELRMVMIDPKMVELTSYNDLPHMACRVVTDVQKHCLPILERLVEEMEDRYRNLGALRAKNISAFNEIVRTKRKAQYPKYEGKWQRMPYVVVVIEEFADFILALGKDAETQIIRLAQKSRAAGIHLVIATQRPSADVVTGLIKANFPTRVAFRVSSSVDSRTILDQSGAENLMGKGDMLYQSAGNFQRIHGAFLKESEIAKMVKTCKNGS